MKVVLDKLTKIFPNAKKKEEVIAVNNFTYEIPDGKLVGLLGPSGCGKSTTLFMLSGLLKPTSGKIIFGEKDVTTLAPEKRGVGLVFQNYALYPHMTVKQNIMFPLQNQKIDKKIALEKTVEVAKLVQIDDLLDRKPSELSGGQQQRVAIARALVKSPNVLLLDEPLSNLDARLRLKTREEIRRIQRETHVTTIFVTHDQEEAMSISDYIVVMKKGVVQQIDVPQKVYDDPKNLFVSKFLGTPPINVFKGYVKDNGVYIGENRIIDFVPENELPDFKFEILDEVAEDKNKKTAVPEILAPVETVSISSASKVHYTGEKVKLSVNCTPDNADLSKLLFTSSDESVAIVDSKGEVSFIREGNVTISVSVSEQVDASPVESSSVDFTVYHSVYVAIRPEGFIVDENGPLECDVCSVEVMGRDSSIVSTHPNSENDTIRSIIGDPNVIGQDQKTVRFSVKENKIFVFDGGTEERIYSKAIEVKSDSKKTTTTRRTSTKKVAVKEN